MSVAVLGTGAFGTALAIALSREGSQVTLWSRDEDMSQSMEAQRVSGARLPGHALPETLTVTSQSSAFSADVMLLAVPTQRLTELLATLPDCDGKALVACCKGVDRQTGLGPAALIQSLQPKSTAAILSGPSFAEDIARGLPTALALATHQETHAEDLQQRLTRHRFRIYRSTDVIGVEMGGALKNVIALAAGIAIGAGLGDSARATVISRGFSEMTRFAAAKGARPETLTGLSGLGDLVLTCTSEKSRNFSAGVQLGQQVRLDPSVTVEGIATAPSVALEAKRMGLDLPVISVVADIVEERLDIPAAIDTLLARPVGKE